MAFGRVWQFLQTCEIKGQTEKLGKMFLLSGPLGQGLRLLSPQTLISPEQAPRVPHVTPSSPSFPPLPQVIFNCLTGKDLT